MKTDLFPLIADHHHFYNSFKIINYLFDSINTFIQYQLGVKHYTTFWEREGKRERERKRQREREKEREREHCPTGENNMRVGN